MQSIWSPIRNSGATILRGHRSARNSAAKPPGAPPFKLGPALATTVLLIVQTAVIALFGYELSGRVELALKQRQGTVAAASAMQQLVNEMQDPKRSSDEYRTYSKKISMFGLDAIRPLILMASSEGPYSEEVPINGLKLIAVLHADETCKALDVALARSELITRVRRPGIEQVWKDLKCQPAAVRPWYDVRRFLERTHAA